MIQAVIYDMDGVIIDSEPLWRDAEIASFATVGISLTDEMCRQTTGLRVDEVVEYWFHRFPTDSSKAEKVEALIWENVIRLVKDKGKAKKGVIESLEFFKSKDLKIALASTSAMVLINTVLDKLNLRKYFAELHSAEFEEFGKPHPNVYITTAKKLEVPAHTCIAIEDSINGILAAKAAKMKCIAIPEVMDDKRLGIADVVVPSLADVNDDLWKQLN
jgi:beta-phosphoglucomutase-like phosphatase (HAD superfamily)